MTFVSLHAIEPWSRGQRRVDGVRVDGMGARNLISTQVTGHLLIEMPKINENAPTLFGKNKARAEKEERLQRLNGERREGKGAPATQKKPSVGVHAKPLDNRRPALSASMADLMVKDSSSRRKKDGMAAVSTRRVDEPPPPPAVASADDDDEPPPPC